MKAIVRDEYGPPLEVLALRDVDVPEVGDDEVLVRVKAASVNAGDPPIVRGMPYVIRLAYGIKRPRSALLGSDIAGIVEAVGRDVTRFNPGDQVYGGSRAAFAEYAAAPEKRLAPKPENVSFEEAAAVPVAGLTALQSLRDAAKLEPGQKVLINGGSGGVGTFAIQVAKALGAEVTAVCSTRNVEQARSLGADHVVDYTKEDFTDIQVRFDVVFDNAASKPLAATRRVMTPKGVLIPNNGNLHSRWLANLPRMSGAMLTSIFASQRTAISPQRWVPDDLIAMNGLVEGGQISPVIERTYDFVETPQAIAYVAQGHARAKVVVRV